MNISPLTIKQKMVLLMACLIGLVSSLIIVVNYKLTVDSRQMISSEISGKIARLQELSEHEMNSLKKVTNEGISEASGLTAINSIVSLALNRQKEFYGTVQDEIGKVGGRVQDTLSSQNQTVRRGLENLFNDSTALTYQMIDFDNESLSVLSNMALFNLDTLKEASDESQEIFARNNAQLDEFLNNMQEDYQHDIDGLLAEAIVKSDTLQGPQLMEYLVQRFDDLKNSSEKRKKILRENIGREFGLQAKVISEEMKIVADKVDVAINEERNNNMIMQKQRMDEVVGKLLSDELNIQNEIKKSAEEVNKSMDQIQTALPLQLKQEGEATNRIIEEQIHEAEAVAGGAQDKVGRMVDQNNEEALKRMTGAVGESRNVIGKTFSDASKKTLLFSIMITAVCVLFAVILGAVMIRRITGPISEVMRFAGKISQRQSTEKLPEGPDEIGKMGAALNKMAHELEELEEATANSFNQTLDQVIDCVFMFDPETLVYQYVNRGALEQTGYSRDELLRLTPLAIKCEFSLDSFKAIISPIWMGVKESMVFTTVHTSKDGRHIPVEILLKYVTPPIGKGRFVEIVRDLTEIEMAEKEKEHLQSQLLHAQKLESVGQLAAGIAHEINTPMQFISTNMEFLEEASRGMAAIHRSIQEIRDAAPPEIAEKLQSALEEADLDYLVEEVPTAINQSKDGISRVTSIVKAMKEFSHPSSREKENVVVNSIIETTILVARNEWKYVSDVTTDLAVDLPAAPCLVDEMGQVILNLLTNAAQAIGEKIGRNPVGEKGEIHISTKVVDSFVEIRIRDTGAGIPVGIRERIFDPFFTTKEVGRGTGQGLAISHDVVTQKHGGTLTFETEEGTGTTFIIRLPLAG